MSRKLKVIISVVAMVVVLSVGGATVALAQEDSPPDFDVKGTSGTNELLDKVAEILGIPVAELEEAFQQAQQELWLDNFTERLENYLDRAVAEGLITEGEAVEIMAWWESHPESLGKIIPGRLFGGGFEFRLREARPLERPAGPYPCMIEDEE